TRWAAVVVGGVGAAQRECPVGGADSGYVHNGLSAAIHSGRGRGWRKLLTVVGRWVLVVSQCATPPVLAGRVVARRSGMGLSSARDGSGERGAEVGECGCQAG